MLRYCDFGSREVIDISATWGPVTSFPLYKPDLFGASYPPNYSGRRTHESRTDSAAMPKTRGTSFFAREKQPSRHRETVPVPALCGSSRRDHFGNQFRAGRSASLLGPACRVCDHPARINPSSVLGVTAERFTRLYIFILLFRVRSSTRAKLSAFEFAGLAKYYYEKLFF